MTTPPLPLVLQDRATPGLLVLTLNRPQAMNALSTALMSQLAGAIDAATADDSVRVLLITGAGRAFCAGLDLKELGGGGLQLGRAIGGERVDPVQSLERCPKPVIAAINGPAVTGGFELALACDVLLASTEARFADTHARIGVAPGWGLSQRLCRVIGPYRARELSFTGNWLGAEQAAAWGLVNRVVPAERLMDEAHALAADMLGTLPAMLTRYKALIRDGEAQPLGEALRMERQRARAFNRAVTAEAVETRREDVRRRNRGG